MGAICVPKSMMSLDDHNILEFFNTRFMDLETQIRALRDTVIRLDEALINKPIVVSKEDIIQIKKDIDRIDKMAQENKDWRMKVLGVAAGTAALLGTAIPLLLYFFGGK